MEDEDRRYPATLPPIIWGVNYGRGDGGAVRGARAWLGAGDLRPRATDANRDGRTEEVAWYDAGNELLQRWTDVDGDGRTDRVVVYREGRVLRVIER